jgi:hypothetical protein
VRILDDRNCRVERVPWTDVAPHTLGRIYAGRSWPDLATMSKVAAPLGLRLSFDPPRTRTDTLPPPGIPAGQTNDTAAQQLADAPLDVDVAGVGKVRSAHVIEAILHNSPRVRGRSKTSGARGRGPVSHTRTAGWLTAVQPPL